MSHIESGIERGFHPLDPEVVTTHDIKMARYPGPFLDGSSDGIIMYKVFTGDHAIIYSGLTSEGKSTINAAEDIIKTIKNLEQEGDLTDFKFFDIQTFRGYDYMPTDHFDITEISIDSQGMAHFRPQVDPSELPNGFFLS